MYWYLVAFLFFFFFFRFLKLSLWFPFYLRLHSQFLFSTTNRHQLFTGMSKLKTFYWHQVNLHTMCSMCCFDLYRFSWLFTILFKSDYNGFYQLDNIVKLCDFGSCTTETIDPSQLDYRGKMLTAERLESVRVFKKTRCLMVIFMWSIQCMNWVVWEHVVLHMVFEDS